MSFSMSSSYLSISSATAVRTPAKDSSNWDAALVKDGLQRGAFPGLLRNGQGADCGLDRVGKPGDLEKVWAFKGTRPQRITEYHIL
jgi:hypothetical protein